MSINIDKQLLANALGPKLPYFTDKGFYSSATYPNAYFYNGKTYIVYQAGETQDPMITSYNHATKEWATPVKVGTNTLTADSHGSPSIVIDNSGYIHVFWGSHSGTGLANHSRSTNVEDISLWTIKAEMPPGNSATYPQVLKNSSNGYLYYFYRDTVGATQTTIDYVSSSDSGETWGSENTIVDFGDTFAQYFSVNFETGSTNKIHVVWNILDYNDSSKRKSVYYAYLNLTNSTMYTVSGSSLGASVGLTETGSCLVWTSGPNEVTSPIVHTYDGVQYVIYGDLNSNYWKSSVWTGSTPWKTANIFTGSTWDYERPDFVITGSGCLDAFVPVRHIDTTVPLRNSFNLMRVNSTNSGSTWNLKEIIFESPDEFYVSYPQVPVNCTGSLNIVFPAEFLIYQYFGVEQYTVSYKMYAHGTNGFVYRAYSQP